MWSPITSKPSPPRTSKLYCHGWWCFFIKKNILVWIVATSTEICSSKYLHNNLRLCLSSITTVTFTKELYIYLYSLHKRRTQNVVMSVTYTLINLSAINFQHNFIRYMGYYTFLGDWRLPGPSKYCSYKVTAFQYLGEFRWFGLFSYMLTVYSTLSVLLTITRPTKSYGIKSLLIIMLINYRRVPI